MSNKLKNISRRRLLRVAALGIDYIGVTVSADNKGQRERSVRADAPHSHSTRFHVECEYRCLGLE